MRVCPGRWERILPVRSCPLQSVKGVRVTRSPWVHVRAATRNTTPLHLAPPPLRDKTPPPTLTRDTATQNSLNTSRMTNSDVSPECPTTGHGGGGASQNLTGFYTTLLDSTLLLNHCPRFHWSISLLPRSTLPTFKCPMILLP